jgi:hypothetical protein
VTGESQSIRRKTSPNSTLFTTNPKFLGLNSDLRVESPAVVYFATSFHIFLFIFYYYYHPYYYFFFKSLLVQRFKLLQSLNIPTLNDKFSETLRSPHLEKNISQIRDSFYLDIPCNKNQQDALFIFNLFPQSTFTCFENIYCPSSRGMHFIFTVISTCHTFKSTDS